MTIPSILLGLALATLYGSLFHLWRGGKLTHLALYVIMSWIGFWLGQWIAESFDLNFFSIGPLHLGMATLGSFFFIVLGHWLGRTNTPKKK